MMSSSDILKDQLDQSATGDGETGCNYNLSQEDNETANQPQPDSGARVDLTKSTNDAL